MWRADIVERITAATGHAFHLLRTNAIGGGCINRAFRFEGRAAGKTVSFFVKCNRADRLAMLMAEFDGLLELAQAQSIRVPLPVCTGTSDGQAYLVTEYIPLTHTSVSGGYGQLAEQLAAMHRYQSEQFGWFRDNTIGTTPQVNKQTNDWPDFFPSSSPRLSVKSGCQ